MKQLRELAFLVSEQLLSSKTGINELLRNLEKEVILNLMVALGDNKSAVSRAAKMSRTALIYKLKEYESKGVTSKDAGVALDK